MPAPARPRPGPRLLEKQGVEFRVWAPMARGLAVTLTGPNMKSVPMIREANGEFVAVIAEAGAGSLYSFEFQDGRRRPDPASRLQPAGVHGPSCVVDPNFEWTDQGWRGLELEKFILYELHTGTSTPEGTFEAIIPRLPYLQQLGVTALELMPVAEFPGSRNWGYDGTALYAPHAAYGGPNGLRRLVDECHRRGLAVVLDVVYNHLGPEGNYLAEFAPYFTGAYRSPWGSAVNFDGPGSDGVRAFFIDNALYWLRDFHVDALRLDAVHGIFDFSARHILDELSEAFHAEALKLGRKAWLIAESNLNDVRLTRLRSEGGYGIDAVWCDDFHHAIHAALTGSTHLYLGDYDALHDFGKALREGFVYDGRYSASRQKRYGSSSKSLPGKAFVAFIQNHDQVGNTWQGRRIAGLVSAGECRVAAALLLFSPFLPLLFMGEEYGENAPFLYFTSHGDADLAASVREGRRRDHAGPGEEFLDPDPQSPETFERCKLSWPVPAGESQTRLFRYYRALIACRKKFAALGNCRKDLVQAEVDESRRTILLERGDPSGNAAVLICNLDGSAQPIPLRPEYCGWHLALYSEAQEFTGSVPEFVPPSQLPASSGAPVSVTLPGYSAALYARVQFDLRGTLDSKTMVIGDL